MFQNLFILTLSSFAIGAPLVQSNNMGSDLDTFVKPTRSNFMGKTDSVPIYYGRAPSATLPSFVPPTAADLASHLKSTTAQKHSQSKSSKNEINTSANQHRETTVFKNQQLPKSKFLSHRRIKQHWHQKHPKHQFKSRKNHIHHHLVLRPDSVKFRIPDSQTQTPAPFGISTL